MKTKKIRLLILVLMAMMVILACGTGDKQQTSDDAAKEPAQGEVAQQPDEEEKVEESQSEESDVEQPAAKVETEFPLLPDAENIQDLQGTITYQSKTSLADAFAFYRKELTALGLKENDILTLDEDDMFQFVFEGSANGKQLVVQTIKLDDKTINVTVRYEELNN